MPNILSEQSAIVAGEYVFLPLTSGLVSRVLVAWQRSSQRHEETPPAFNVTD